MASVYFHIPYCRKACTYCNFHFSTQVTGLDAMVEAMLTDWKFQQDFIPDTQVESIYFGGGTPSVMPYLLLEKLIQRIQSDKTVEKNAEITLEANPEDISPENLRQWKRMGINRISLGVQSLNDAELLWMNRAHSAHQSKQSVADILSTGDFILSIDLIYGSHLKSARQWQHELDWVQESGIHHLSCYALTVEEKTALHKIQHQGTEPIIQDEFSTSQFQQLCEWAQNTGWNHYEISNLSRSELTQAQHNQKYWNRHPYWGIGPGAHGYNGIQRRWNVSNNTLYKKFLQEPFPALYFETELLSKNNQFNELLMTQLRLLNGVSLQSLSACVSSSVWKRWMSESEQAIKKWENLGHLKCNQDRLVLTSSGRWFADAVTAELMLAAED